MTAILVVSICLAGVVDTPVPMWTTRPYSADTLPRSVGTRLTSDELAALRNAAPKPPFDDFVSGIRLDDGGIWLAASNGVMFQEAGTKSWKLFHSRRWLPAEQVKDFAVIKDGSVFLATPNGIGSIIIARKSLEQKAHEIHADLRRYHVREGLIGEIQLKEPGRVDAGWFQPDSDNDGLWTSLYVGAEAFRYGTTKDPAAKQNAWQSLHALMFLEKVTGISGFAARSIVPSSAPKPQHGEWHKSSDGKWWWKGDTSSDEVVGHYFAYAVYYDLCATPEEKEQIRQVVSRITDHIIDHGFYYVGPPGKPTTWGVWAPEKLNLDVKWAGDRGLNSLEVLSHLKVAHHITQNPRYADAAAKLINPHGYALNTVQAKIVWPYDLINHSDDELAFLSYYPLLLYEREPKLRRTYMMSLERSWFFERPEHGPFFNFIYAAGKQADVHTDISKRPEKAGINPDSYDRQICIDWFRDVPQDLYRWTVKNSGRKDLGEIVHNRAQRANALRVLNIAERPLMRWNGDPYQLDGGNDGRVRDDGTFILLPYWMGRYHRFLE